MRTCTHVHTYVQTHTHTRTHKHTHACTHTHTHTNTHTHTYINTCICTHSDLCTDISRYTQRQTQTNTHRQTHTHTNKHTCMHVHMHMCETHILAHTLAYDLPKASGASFIGMHGAYVKRMHLYRREGHSWVLDTAISKHCLLLSVPFSLYTPFLPPPPTSGLPPPPTAVYSLLFSCQQRGQEAGPWQGGNKAGQRCLGSQRALCSLLAAVKCT